tara:strand:- start:3245 stop:7609 length:4365 start_codon:yes stop_codon:yes gene_type:complete
MNLNEFITLVFNNLATYIDDNTDLDYNDLSDSQLEAVRNQIRSSITETQEIYDSNGFTNVIRTNIASVLTDLAGSADIELPDNFIIEFADKLQQISDDQITQYYLSGGLGEDAPTTQAEPVVDMETRMQEVIDNSESVVEKDVRLAIDEIAKQEDVTSRAALLADVKVENSLILGENKKVVIAIANTDEQVDNTISKFIDTYAKENDMVVEVVTYDDVSSQHLEGARQFSVSDIEYRLNQEAVESKTSTHYFPKSDEEMQKLLSNYLTEKESNITRGNEIQRTQKLYPGGPTITTNQIGHQGFNVHLRNMRYSEIQSILDKSKIKAVMVAGNKSGGETRDMSPVFKGGIGKYFKRLGRKAEGERFQAIANKPGYTIGYVYVAPNGTEHIVSLIHSDIPSYRVHANDIDYSSDWKKANIQTNFFTFHPAVVDGYYPNIYDGTFSKKKFLIQMKVNEWFQGMLHLADLDGVTIDQSPINGQVANLYQKGGFIWTDELHLYNDRLAPFEGTGGMIRLPSGNRNVIDGWKAELNTKPEWQVINSESTIVNTRWSSPDQVTMVAKKRKYGPGDLKYSERHRALITLSQMRTENTTGYQIRTANEAILRISGLYGLDASTLLPYYDSSDTLAEAKYIFPRSEISDILDNLARQSNPKFLAEAILNSTHLEKITGLDVDLLSDQEKDILNYKEKIPLETTEEGRLTSKSSYRLFESIVDGISPSILNEFDITLATDITDVEEINKIYLDDFEDAQQQLQEAARTPERDRFTNRVQTEEGLRSYSFESIRQLYNENVGNYEGFYGQIRQTLADNPQLMDDDFGLHVVDFDHVSTYLVDDDALVAPILEQSNNRSFITDEARHIFTRNLQALLEKENSTLLTSDINFVGSRDGIYYIEVGTVQERVNDIGDLVFHKEYTTYSLDRSRDGTNIRLRNVLSTSSTEPTHAISNALALMFTEYDVPLDYSLTGGLLDKIHPSGTIGYQMGVVNSRDAGTVNRSRGNTSFGFEDPQVLREATTPDALQTTLGEFRNQPRRPKVSNTDVSPQPFYTKMVFEDIRAGVNNNVNDVINLLSDLVDNKTTGAYSLNIYKGNYTTLVGQVLKRHGQPMQFIGMPGNESNFVVRGGRIPDDLFIGDATLVAPHQDFMNGVILESLQNPQVDRGELFHVLGNQKIDSSNNGEVVRHYDVAAETFVPIVEDDNLPRIRANYSLGTDIGDGGADFVGSAFNPDRTPVGSKPDPMTLRKIARSFAKTKTGKTLGLAWKTIDIGETLISKGFAQAQKAAAAAGAATLGGAAAFAATLWALYEVSNLIVAAGQQIPELRNVIAKRNEILKNGEEWEKQIVEETFWQDYGPQIIEALQRAGDRSPSELLSDKIWSFTLDNLRRQSEGEVFEDALIDTSEDLDIRDDIYRARVPNNYKLEQMQNNIDYDKVLTGYYNNRPEANVIANRTLQLANDVYNRDR